MTGLQPKNALTDSDAPDDPKGMGMALVNYTLYFALALLALLGGGSIASWVWSNVLGMDDDSGGGSGPGGGFSIDVGGAA